MTKAVRVLIVAGVVVIVIPALIVWIQHSSHGRALGKYKAQLRAKGEKLTWAEMGFPRAPETNDSLTNLLTAVTRLGAPDFDSSFLAEPLHYVTPGQVRPVDRETSPRMAISTGSTKSGSWEEFDARLRVATGGLQEVRDAVRNPPGCFYVDPTNFFNLPRHPFVAMRSAGQWLMADAIDALHSGQLARAREDIHALAQLAQFYRDDPVLVSQMIRIAISGLGLNVTWEALQAQGWTETDLAAMQKDSEGMDAISALEKGMLGVRAQGEEVFAWMRRENANQRLKLFNAGVGNSSPLPLGDRLQQWGTMALWRANPEPDELFLLGIYQQHLDVIRKLQRGTPWPSVRTDLKSVNEALNAKGANFIERIRYLVSRVSIPSMAKAGEVAVRNETQRRLTITAIALERYRLQHGQWPAALDALAPEPLSAVPVDPMSGKPLCYRLNTNGTFTLYSVGEDGRDDGGDPNPSSATNKFDLWSGKDAVWPTAAGD